MAWNDASTAVPQREEAFGGAALVVVVVAEGWEAVVVEAGGEVGDVGAEDQVIADADGLVPRGVPWRQQQLDRAVAEQVVIAVDEDHPILDALVVAGQEEVASDRLGILARFPLASLQVDRQGLGQQRKASGVIELMSHLPFKGRRPIFIGDDVTDESVFAIMPDFGGLAFSVGRRAHGVAGHFDEPRDVRDWLAHLLDDETTAPPK